MKNQIRKIQTTLAACLLLIVSATGLRAADISENDTLFLMRYEQVRAGLAADNLEKAKQAAGELGDEGKPIVESKDLATARVKFATLSERAVKLAKGQDGFYVVRCPMLKKEWVQNATTISNPYAGKSMPTCGVIKK